MPASSEIVITYDGSDDITGHVLFELTSFEAQMAAVPGTFTVVCEDQAQTLEFETGRELTLDVDGTRMYGGYILQATKRYAFPADKTPNPSSVKSRQWVLTGVDYNILFDKRVLRNESDYTHDIDPVTGDPTDGEIIRDWFPTYFDIPSGFDFTDTGRVLDNHTFDTTGQYEWDTQGTKMRDVLEDLAQYGSVYWIDANKDFHFLPIQDTAAGWGLSDKPNNNAWGIGSPTRGFRDGEMIEDATAIVNDALVWGGSQWADDGDIVFDRRENSSSITDHKRWQLAENRVGDANYKIQAEVTARAKIIVDGNASGTFAEGSKGLVNPEKQFRGTWFAHQVPEDSGVRQHFVPGQVVPIELQVFDFTMNVPLRQVRITFPELDPTEDPSGSWVQLEGFFGVLMADPHWLWAYLRSINGRSVVSRKAAPYVIATANNGSSTPPYGSLYSDEPTPSPDSSTTTFSIPFSYVGGTLRVVVGEDPDGGFEVRPGIDFLESDPAAGEFDMTTAPATGKWLWCYAVLSGI